MGNIFTILLIQPLANGLILFYHLFGNLGVAIIAFSIVLKLVLNPLSSKSLQNMKRMQELKPHIAKLKARHKGDQQKFLKAQADLYKEKGFNPMAGCLPQILQIIVLYAFLGIFSSVFDANAGSLVENFNKLLYEPLKLAAEHTMQTIFLYVDITKPDVIRLPGIAYDLPGPILLLSALAQFISAKIMMPTIQKEEKIAKKTPSDTDDAMVASQQLSIVMLPILTIFIGVRFASGLALYWLVFSTLQAYQQYRIAGWGGLAPLLKRLKLLN